MTQHQRRLAAAAYDRGLEGPRCSVNRTSFVGVPLLGRTVLCELTLTGDPPVALALAVTETLAILRVMWMALLRCEPGRDRRTLDAVHAALQCELVATEWAWSGGAGEGHALARTLARRREGHRAALAAMPPVGLGLLLPRHARANEALPGRLAAAWEATKLHDEADDALGAWRLGELEAADAASILEAPAEELPALRVAS